MELGCVLFAGEYGLITDLARAYGASRQVCSGLRDRAVAPLVDWVAERAVRARAMRTAPAWPLVALADGRP